MRKLATKLRIAAGVCVVAAVLVLGGLVAKNVLLADAPSNLEVANIVYVVDGDTLCVQRWSTYGPEKVRLIGIDAAESVAPEEYLERTNQENTQEGKDAAEHLRALLPAGTTVWLQQDTSDTDRYGRLLRYVWLEKPSNAALFSEAESKMLNALLVKEGWATPKSYKPDTAYSSLFERLAR